MNEKRLPKNFLAALLFGALASAMQKVEEQQEENAKTIMLSPELIEKLQAHAAEEESYEERIQDLMNTASELKSELREKEQEFLEYLRTEIKASTGEDIEGNMAKFIPEIGALKIIKPVSINLSNFGNENNE